MRRALQRYQDPVAIDKLAAVQKKTDNLRSLMQSNIRDIMKNTEQVEVLQGEVEDMETTARDYKSKATELKNYYWWKDTQLQLLIAFAIVVVIILILWGAGLLGGKKDDGGGGGGNNNHNSESG